MALRWSLYLTQTRWSIMHYAFNKNRLVSRPGPERHALRYAANRSSRLTWWSGNVHRSMAFIWILSSFCCLSADSRGAWINQPTFTGPKWQQWRSDCRQRHFTFRWLRFIFTQSRFHFWGVSLRPNETSSGGQSNYRLTRTRHLLAIRFCGADGKIKRVAYAGFDFCGIVVFTGDDVTISFIWIIQLSLSRWMFSGIQLFYYYGFFL